MSKMYDEWRDALVFFTVVVAWKGRKADVGRQCWSRLLNFFLVIRHVLQARLPEFNLVSICMELIPICAHEYAVKDP
jgi:hypothetical protein